LSPFKRLLPNCIKINFEALLIKDNAT